MESSLPSPMTARVYVDLPEGIVNRKTNGLGVPIV